MKYIILFLLPILTWSNAKNILFIISDDLKADALNCYGNKSAHTPNIDKLASEGTLFQNAYCQGTVCAPSRASFMRGKYFGKNEITWGEHFQNYGYSSTRVGKIFHMRVPGDIIAGTDGQDVEKCWTAKYNIPGREAHTPGNYACLNLNKFTKALEGRETTRMPNRMFVTVDYIGDGSDQPDWKAATKSIELLKQFKKDKKPFFLATGLIRPHYPNVAPKQYFDLYPFRRMNLPFVPDDDWKDMPKAAISNSNSKFFGIDKFPDNQKKMWTGYLATVSFMDEQVGRILKALKELELDKNTVVFFTSDHGYLLGEHHFWQKNNLREEVVRVPLIIKSPATEPSVNNSVVELIDLFPTACHLVGIPKPHTIQGASLVPIIQNAREKIKESAMSYTSRGTLIRTKEWAFMKYKDGSEELYDMIKDSKQFVNLASSPKHRKILADLRRQYRVKLNLTRSN